MNAHINYILSLADTALILSQRNSEWCGHGPILEQDIAITNFSLDQLGQARYLYQHAAERMNQLDSGLAATEDSLAYLRNEREFMNPLITELPKGDWAFTVLRQYFMSAYFHLLYTALQRSTDPQLAAIAAKALKEVDYHLKWSKEWVVRLGDGTEESHERMTNALNELWAYTGELFMPADYEQETVIKGIAADCQSFKLIWMDLIHETLQEATLDIPTNLFMHSGGKSGKHTENMGYILAEMQYMQRSYPGCEW